MSRAGYWAGNWGFSAVGLLALILVRVIPSVVIIWPSFLEVNAEAQSDKREKKKADRGAEFSLGLVHKIYPSWVNATKPIGPPASHILCH